MKSERIMARAYYYYTRGRLLKLTNTAKKRKEKKDKRKEKKNTTTHTQLSQLTRKSTQETANLRQQTTA